MDGVLTVTPDVRIKVLKLHELVLAEATGDLRNVKPLIHLLIATHSLDNLVPFYSTATAEDWITADLEIGKTIATGSLETLWRQTKLEEVSDLTRDLLGYKLQSNAHKKTFLEHLKGLFK